MIEKDYFTISELIAQTWFPVKSPITTKRLIEQGKIVAVDISTNSKYKRYRINKKSALEFTSQNL